MRRPSPTRSTVTAIMVALALALMACSDRAADEATGGDTEADEAASPTTEDGAAEDGADGASATYPVTIDGDSGPVEIPARPERIVSLSSTATEMLFAIGAGDQVVAVDSFSNYPPEAPITDLSAFEPNLEAIAANEPDLVLLGFPNPDVEAGLAGLDIPVAVLGPAATLDDSYDQIAQLGIATDNVDGAAATNAEIRRQVDEVVDRFAGVDQPIRIYHELDDTFFSASSGSFIGHLYELLGFENVADAADPDGSLQFPQLQAEQILAADPTLIVFTDAYEYGVDDIAARPGWGSLSAVESGNVVEVDADIASRWGPRVVDFLQLVVDRVAVPAG